MDELLSFNHTIEALKKYSEDLRQRYQSQLTDDDHIATGNLLKSVTYHIEAQSKQIEISFNLENYWKYVEDDTRPHFPPISAILEWVKVKPVLPSKTYNGKLPTQKQLAFLIARKISEVGTKGTHDLETVRDEADDSLDRILGEAVTQDVNECLDKLLAF